MTALVLVGKAGAKSARVPLQFCDLPGVYLLPASLLGRTGAQLQIICITNTSAEEDSIAEGEA